jgi:hypothetical protein
VNDGTLLFVNFAAYSWLLLIPVIGIEAWELKKALPVSTGRAAAASGLANLVSTALVTIAVLGTGWVLGFLDVIAQPQAGEGDLAVLIALVPCFFLSVWADTMIGSVLLKRLPRADVRSAFLQANQLAYSMIAIVPVARFIKSAIVNGRIIW